MTSLTSLDELSIPNRPDVPGLRFRHWRGLEDLAGMAAANQLARDDAGVEEVINAGAMTRTYTHLVNCDLAQDLVVVERDGRTIGYVRLEWRDLTNGARQFRDHRDEAEWTEEDWARFPEELPDVSLWVIAFDNDAVAGGIFNTIDPAENAHHGRARGALATVWTGARWRRRGVAKALIARSLVRLRVRGMTSAYLGVDGANPNQAMDLYAALGFEVATSTIDWRKPLPEHGAARAGGTR